MGGDGGVIASNRKYLRGAGVANKTADRDRDRAATSKQVESDESILLERMRTCQLTRTALDFTHPNTIVVCPYGRLYSKEAAVEALLRRKQQQQTDATTNKRQEQDELGHHIRGLKDLHPVRFFVTKDGNDNNNVPICPVTGIELNGKHPAFVVVPTNKKSKGGGEKEKEQNQHPNVLSERAIKEIGLEALQADYGPFEQQDLIRLVPSESMLENEIRPAVAKKQAMEKEKTKTTTKKTKKEGRKRKKMHDDDDGNVKRNATTATAAKFQTNRSSVSGGTSTAGVANTARERVAAAVASNDVLSSLFTSTSNKKET